MNGNPEKRGQVLIWPRHQIISHDSYPELGGCAVCGGWEGELPTDCPGEEMDEVQKFEILHGRLDYLRKEGWTNFPQWKRRQIKRLLCE